MPVANTRRFGELNYEDSSALHFPWGLPGFEKCTRFTLVERPGFSPIAFLQSLDDAELCFLAAPVTAIDPLYEPAVMHEDLDRLNLPNPPLSDALLLALLCAPENGPLTANLLAPVVVNLRTRVAVQAVRPDQRYSHQHPLPSGPAEVNPCEVEQAC